MSRTIDYVYTLMSPWAYLGFEPFHAIAKKHDVTIRYRPIPILEVFNETGGLPLGKRPPTRQAYRLVELQRWRAIRGVPLVLQAKRFPFEAALADKLAIAVLMLGLSPEAYLRAAHRAVWAEDRNLGDEGELANLLNATGYEAAKALAEAKSEACAAAFADNREYCLASGIFGAPSYVLDGEIYWGQDRLDLLDHALTSGRPPYRPDGDA
ncbi:MAG: disulfide bond formation protein DsbA [Rhizobiales bacterium PAR1]|nr:MAG: disulfide bond formation protein DsbA [Rhizobiales bacterium PAR1]